MSTLSAQENADLRRKLEDAVVKCSERCLYQSAKWMAELLNSLPQSSEEPGDTEPNSPMSGADDIQHDAGPGILSHNIDILEARLEIKEAHRYLMAKSYFDCREYDRCAAVFLPDVVPRSPMRDPPSSGSRSKKPSDSVKGKSKSDLRSSMLNMPTSIHHVPHLSQKSLFLALYARYISGEKRKDEESEMILGPADGGATVNREVAPISQILRSRLSQASGSTGQGWLEYLYGIVLAKSKNYDEARQWLLRSLNLYSFNWGAWQELSALIGSNDELQSTTPHLPQNLLSFIFYLHTKQELLQGDPTLLTSLKQLRSLFPNNPFLTTQKALMLYHTKDFERAEKTFSKLTSTHPLRLDATDTYSNILYVMEKRPKLAFLAQLATSIDKFRPETCVVVGNYYAMKSEHEKAVMYFRRALTLDRNFLAAWTLMGHEYVEMKNTQAAIECYRRAVDVNRKDYRAWYGLGQTYEVLEMHFYALYYYERAAGLASFDPKMWTAVGACLEKMRRPAQALKAFKRALAVGSYYDAGGASSFGSGSLRSSSAAAGLLDPEVLYSIANMYDALGDVDETKAYLELVLAQEEGGAAGEDDDAALRRSTMSSSGSGSGGATGVGVTATTSKARLWLVKMEMARGGREALGRAVELADELVQDGYEVEEAKGLVGEIRGRMEVEVGAGDEGVDTDG